VKIDKGSGDGIRVDQPVIAAGGLVGKITDVTGGTAEVRLLTDASSAVTAQVMPAGASGVVRPQVGDPGDLLLDLIEGDRRVTKNTTVVTSGFTSSKIESLFPRGIPIGRVSKVDLDELEQYQRVHITPFADLRRFDIVQVLTRRPAGEQAAALTGTTP
jgi:rod shape-determining protein MreC